MSREERGFRKTRGVFLEGHVSIICKTWENWKERTRGTEQGQSGNFTILNSGG